MQPSTTVGHEFVPAMILERAAATPDAVAVADGHRCLTYGELDQWSGRLARHLAGNGVGPESVVGLFLSRSIEQAVGLLGVLRAGAAFLPLDTQLPPARLGIMVAAAHARQIITTAGLRPDLPDVGTVPVSLIDDLPECDASDPRPPADPHPENLAYVIFTSGSTGEPKPVAIPHRALSNLVAFHHQYTKMDSDDRASMWLNPAFDASVVEVLPALAAGASLHVAPPSTVYDPIALQAWLLDTAITIACLPTPMGELVLPLPWPAETPLRRLLVGGAQLHLRPNPAVSFEVHNVYGPTEATVYSTIGLVEPGGAGLPDIGRPITGAQTHILNTHLQPQPPTTPGELHLGGTPLARGYLHQPHQTADRFIPHPHQPGQRLYRTGDLTHHNPNNTITYHTRTDHQLKINGHRIEPAEIENTLQQHPHIHTAHITTHPHPTTHQPQITAYITPTNPHHTPTTQQLKHHIHTHLPTYMHPTHYILLTTLPHTTNGKIDHTKLPTPHHQPTTHTPPTTPLQHQLTTTWQHTLNRQPISIHDNFFDLGGHSLLAFRIINEISRVCGRDVPVVVLFANPTIAELADYLENAPPSTGPAPVGPAVPARADRSRNRLSLIHEEVWFFAKLAPENIAYHAQGTIRVTGPLDVDVLERALTLIASRHELLRSTFEEDEDGQPWQVVQPPEPIRVARVDLTDVPPAERATRAEALVHQEVRRAFDLTRLPLFRWTAIKLGPHEHELVMVEHHFVHDGWSFVALSHELRVAYAALIRGAEPVLPELPIQYGDFAEWQHGAMTSPFMAAQLDYWREQLAGAPAVLDLPTDRPRPRTQSLVGGRLRLDLPPGLASAMRVLGRAEGATLFTVLYSGFAAWLHRYSGQSDLSVGSGFANRRIPEAEHLIGMFVNTVVLRCRAEPDLTFRGLMARARDVIIGAAANQEYPFSRLVQQLRPQRDLGRNPFFQVMFSFHDTPTEVLDFAGSPGTVFEQPNGSSKVDINLTVIPRAERQIGEDGLVDERITVLWEYNGDLFDEATAERMAAQYVRLLEQFAADPDLPLREATLIGAADRAVRAPAAPGPLDRQPSPYVAPATDLQHQVTAVWQHTLGREPIGIHDNFFDLGGHSLLAMKIVARIRSALGIHLPLASIFEQPTIAALCDAIESGDDR